MGVDVTAQNCVEDVAGVSLLHMGPQILKYFLTYNLEQREKVIFTEWRFIK